MLWVALYALSIVAANVLITVVGVVPVGFGLMAPAGVYAVGLAFWLRDQVHESVGSGWTIVAILAGALISAFLSPGLALASGTAFLASELADMLVYVPLRRRHWLGAVALSNTVGLVVDSMLFLWLAFGSLDFLAGQIWGKFAVTLATVAVLWLVRRHRGAILAGHASAGVACGD